MAAESPSSEINLAEIGNQDISSLTSKICLQDALDACLKSFESGDFDESSQAVATAVELLDSIADSLHSDSSDATIDISVAERALEEILSYLSSPLSNQMVVEALSLELPKVVVKFISLSDQCQQTAQSIIDGLVATCSPRDMLAILCEALDSQITVSKSPIYFIPLLSGISKVFLCIQRRHLEQVKVALPVVLDVLQASTSEAGEEDKDTLRGLFGAAVSIAISIQEVGRKMVGRIKTEFHAIFGLYILQNIDLISRIKYVDTVSSYSSIIMKLLEFLPFRGFTFFGLITGSEVTSLIDELAKGDDDDNGFLSCFSLAENGSALAVIWARINDGIAKTDTEKLTSVLTKLQSNRTESMMVPGVVDEQNDDHIDFSSFIPSLFTTLQAIQRIMIYATDVPLRKKAFSTFKKLISDLPSAHRFDMLRALITNSKSPSMIAILVDLVRGEMAAEVNWTASSENDLNRHPDKKKSSFWSSCALNLVELILKPPKGGPPSFPEDSEPVLSALNLFRFTLITESTRKTNHTSVMSKHTLQKAYSDWLLPLRTLVSGVRAETEKDESELSDHILCTLNPVQLVLCRCIELVEDNLRHIC
ncbi:aberrant root formation protein 4-like isoform X2 [Zingiber officinale]|uniref:aberrant root formation protein 4-like isoform X2 n=1 Tax=Zingiber officinale TaxID=94328 RepID=UPI001C4C99CB|nr:aberrant root formation protein 4-like isoform X2 [Zingiber officinale]